MVEIFKTNVRYKKEAGQLLALLSKNWPLAHINFDLNDCDNILRVDGKNVSSTEIIELLKSRGYECEMLN